MTEAEKKRRLCLVVARTKNGKAKIVEQGDRTIVTGTRAQIEEELAKIQDRKS